MAKSNLQKKERELIDLNNEVIKSIRGESEFTKDILNSLITQTKQEIEDEQKNITATEAEVDDCNKSNSLMKRNYNRLISWSELYENSSLDRKKMIVAQLIDTIYIRKDYDIVINFKISFKQFLSMSTVNFEPQEEYPENAIVVSM